MRTLIISDDIIHPPNSGGRRVVDDEVTILGRISEDIGLVAYYRRNVARREAVRLDLVRDRYLFLQPRRSIVSATVTHPVTPFQLSSRCATATLVKLGMTWNPDIVVAHHEWTLPTARAIASATKAALVLRSHNDETAYYNDLRASAQGLRRAYFGIESRRISRALGHDFYKGVDLVWVIAPDDAEAYVARGLRTSWLPALIGAYGHEHSTPSGPRAGRPTYLYVGSLDMPHATQGLNWFLREVWPMLLSETPAARVSVAGRRANTATEDQLRSTPGVEYLGEVSDTAALYTADAIFINPIFSGSGVSMKVAEPASHGVPIVSTRFGMRGFPSLAGFVHLADNALDFQRGCREAAGPSARMQGQAAYRQASQLHSQSSLEELARRDLLSLLGERRRR